MVYHGSLKESFEFASGLFRGWLKDVSKMFLGYFEGGSRVSIEILMGVSKVFEDFQGCCEDA